MGRRDILLIMLALLIIILLIGVFVRESELLNRVDANGGLVATARVPKSTVTPVSITRRTPTLGSLSEKGAPTPTETRTGTVARVTVPNATVSPVSITRGTPILGSFVPTETRAGIVAAPSVQPAMRSRMQVIAHRGGSSEAPENTMAAFELAVKQGATMLELDVSVSKDGQFVVIHDATVDRTTNGKGLVKDLTLQQLKLLDAGSRRGSQFAGERIPTLEEVLDWAKGKIPVLLDLKFEFDESLIDKLVTLVRSRGGHDEVRVLAYYTLQLVAVKRASTSIRTYLLSERIGPGDYPVSLAAAANADGYMMEKSLADDRLISLLHGKGLEVFVYTLSQADEMRRFVKLGVDGILTDNPYLLRTILDSSR